MADQQNARAVVLAFVKALNDENFELAKSYVSDDIDFDGVLGSRRGSRDYFADMEKMRLKYDVKKVFVDGNDVCVLEDVMLKGSPVFTCAWYRVESGKIRSLKVVFDPRPVLADKAA